MRQCVPQLTTVNRNPHIKQFYTFNSTDILYQTKRDVPTIYMDACIRIIYNRFNHFTYSNRIYTNTHALHAHTITDNIIKNGNGNIFHLNNCGRFSI